MTKVKKIPMRRCIGCMESKPKKELLRLVADDGKPVFDPTGKSNGRGVYLCFDESCFEKAKKRKAIPRGLAIDGIGDEEYETLKSEFVNRIANGEVTL